MDRSSATTARPRTILAIASEWSSGHGGLSTFNRELCRSWAGRYPGDRVLCLVPKASREEREAARADRVQLLEAEAVPGTTEEARLLLEPPLPGGVTPDVIVGHGKVTGPAALVQRGRFPGSRRVHFIHVTADEIEPFKGGAAARTSEDKTQLEIALARGAELVCAVGPRLARELGTALHSHGVRVHRFDPGLPRSSARSSEDLPPGVRVLVLGRAEDVHLKGLDIAARAFSQVAARLQPRPKLFVRGAPRGTGDTLRNHLRDLAATDHIHVLEYSDDAARIEADLGASSLLLMPSRAEGFGLVALEAVAAGVPVLASHESGFAELLAECEEGVSRRHVVPVEYDEAATVAAWARAIDLVLADRTAAFRRAHELRQTLEGRLAWQRSLEALVAALDAAPAAPAERPPSAPLAASPASAPSASPAASPASAPSLGPDGPEGRELLAAWLRRGEALHAQIRVLGLREAPPGPPAQARLHPEARRPPLADALDVFVPLYVQPAPAGAGSRGRHGDLPGEQPTQVTLDEALRFASQRGPARMVLLGDPGSGKTTILRHLFGCLARDGAPRPDAPAPLAGLHPVWIHLSSLTGDELAAADLAPVVRRVAQAEGHAAAAEVVLRDGSPRLLILLDGLDEMRDASLHTQTLALLDRAVLRWPRSAFVLTSRLTQWRPLQRTPEWDQLASRFVEVAVAPLDEDTRSAYVRAWRRAHERWSNALREPAAIRAAAEKWAASLLQQLAAPPWTSQPRLLQMIANPLMLSTLCALHAPDRPLPDRPAELYDVVLQLLIESWHRDARSPLPHEEARQVLEPLAYRSQEGKGRALGHDVAVAIVDPPLAQTRALRIQTPTATAFLAAMRDGCGILAGDEPGAVEFLHLQLREYLAATHVRRQALGAELAGRLGGPEEAHWRETMLLAMQLPGVSGPFLEEALASRAHVTSQALVRACVVEAGAQLESRPIERAMDAALERLRGATSVEPRAEAQSDLEALFALVQDLELPGMADRRRAFDQALDRTAAQRNWDWTPGRPMILPVTGMAFQWIKPGQFMMGSTDEAEDAYPNEKPAHWVTITRGYWMGEHPVTNAQYREFVEATGHQAPSYWDQRRFGDPAQPVVGVSWEDAQAFCAWVNKQVPAGNALRFRLPTEAEWEYAARGTDGRRYPWPGDEPPDTTRATFGLRWSTGGPSPVGQHPAGVSPFGLHDMAGNVYEWCRDWYGRYQDAPEIDPVGDMPDSRGSNQVIRGGAWHLGARGVRAACRLAYQRDGRVAYLGFRLAGGQAAPRQ